MELVFASTSANIPHTFYIHIGICFMFASADAADETSALTFASALWAILIFASAPCRGGYADYWVSLLPIVKLPHSR